MAAIEVFTIPQCFFCKNYDEQHLCIAYPAGIPDKILNNEHDHRKPYSGDNGIQFEAVDDSQD